LPFFLQGLENLKPFVCYTGGGTFQGFAMSFFGKLISLGGGAEQSLNGFFPFSAACGKKPPFLPVAVGGNRRSNPANLPRSAF
jgi:hypothetical protein